MLSLSPSTIICTLINLLVLYLFLRKFLFGKVTAIMDARQKMIEHNIAAAEDQRTKAESMLSEYNEKMKDAQTEANAVMSTAKQRAEQEYQIILSKAQSDAKQLGEQAEKQIEQDRLAMVAGVRAEVADLALLAAAHVAGKTRGTQDDADLVESFLSEVGEPS